EVSARLEGTVPAPPSVAAIVEELEHMRTALGEETRADDRAALLQQWDRHSALLRHLRGASRPEAVDAGSPYFAHMRLAEDGGQGAALRAHDIGAGADRRLGAGVRRRADKHLPDIVGLIDPAQFELVSRPSAGFLLIRGTAGSGKTTVALHRIAFLAYHDAGIDSSATLVVVFSPALRDYVSHVLPALGVARVQVRAFHEWASDVCARLFPRLPRRIRD